MKNKKTTFLLCITLSFLLSECKVNKNTTSSKVVSERFLPEIIVKGNNHLTDSLPYQSSIRQQMQLINTTLWLSFDYSKQQVLGKAKLTLKPYFYPQDSIQLDAKKFILHKVALLSKDTILLKYSYDEKIASIILDKPYTKDDSIVLYIEYTARPNDVKEQGSAAISDAKGLYFINPLKTDSTKPRQIWSQGETQSNSGWFPTIDYPNQKMTQDIFLTVDKTDRTLSNGELIYSQDNHDGTRTDYWSQLLPHAPYLTMIAIGEFIETKDTWRDSIEVNYYLEKEYAPYAKLIFGKTPEMMECFSKRLGVEYPWEKFSQIVVRDFVSGAMENTSAVIHFEPVQHDSREHLDNNWEDIISHELFHHWFGDLVTCESWSNISLNESFATYGEYLWTEYAYGKMNADCDFDDNLRAYLNQKSAAKKDLIRFHYKSREDMFDVVSYQKGSRVIHMLRNYVGDDAFFASLKLYLTKHKFKTVEIHDLRLAVEEVTGEDLNWFFEQWYFNSGHPILDITYTYNKNKTAVHVNVKQLQDTIANGIFRLPVAIDTYSNGKATRNKVIVDKSNWNIDITSESKIELTTFDADRILLAKITDHKTLEEFENQLLYAPLYMDKKQAVIMLTQHDIDTLNSTLLTGINNALNDTFYGVRELGLKLISALPEDKKMLFESKIISLATTDAKASIRANAIQLLSTLNVFSYETIFKQGVNDSAYSVVGKSISALAEINASQAIESCQPYLKTRNNQLQLIIAEVIASDASTDYVPYFEHQLAKESYYGYQLFSSYATYLTKQDSTIQLKALPQLKKWYTHKNQSFHYDSKVEQCIGMMQKEYEIKRDNAVLALKNKKNTQREIDNLERIRESSVSMIEQLLAVIKNIE